VQAARTVPPNRRKLRKESDAFLENSGNEPNFIRKFRRWRWFIWLRRRDFSRSSACYAVYEVISYFVRATKAK